MSDLGKADPEFLAAHVLGRLGADRPDVRLGPTPGVDFGIVDVEDSALVLATDPVSVLPELGFERAGRFGLHVVLSDVAVSGLVPSHLAISFGLPSDIEDEEFAALWGAIDRECADLGTAIVAGHTARYPGANYPWVGAATAFSIGDPGDIVRPDGARPGDRILVTKGPAVETTGLLTTLFPEAFEFDEATLRAAQARLDETSLVRDATAAAAAGPVTAMHDATEGGLSTALVEMADSAGVRFEVTSEEVPLAPGVEATCEALDIDPWAATSSGTLVLTVDPEGVDEVVGALEARNTPVGVVGRVVRGSGVRVDGEERAPPERDPSWEAYADLSGTE